MINSDFKTLEEFIAKFYEANPFTKLVGLELMDPQGDNFGVQLKIQEKHTNVYGIAHGGVILTMMDMTMGAACLKQGAKVVTLNLNNNFIKALKVGDTAYGKASVVHQGKTTLVAECKIYNQENKLCATATGTFLRIGNIEL